MNIHILSAWDAQDFVPTKPTYGIRIFSTWQLKDPIEPLVQSPFYIHVASYIFDDNDTHPWRMENGPKWFDSELADLLITDFEKYKDSVDALMVHCSRGINRSPAVAIALNERYSLGQNGDALKQKYEMHNRWVYLTLCSRS